MIASIKQIISRTKCAANEPSINNIQHTRALESPMAKPHWWDEVQERSNKLTSSTKGWEESNDERERERGETCVRIKSLTAMIARQWLETHKYILWDGLVSAVVPVVGVRAGRRAMRWSYKEQTKGWGQIIEHLHGMACDVCFDSANRSDEQARMWLPNSYACPRINDFLSIKAAFKCLKYL